VSGYKAIASSQKRTVKNIVLGPRSSASVRRPYDNLGANGFLHNRCSYSVTTFWTLPPLFSQETQGRHKTHNQRKRTAQRMAVKLELHYG